jgi:hypothetical protein
VITEKFYNEIVKQESKFEDAVKIIMKLPPVHYNTFHYVTSFLRQVLINSDSNNLSLDKVAVGFAGIFIFNLDVIIPSPKGKKSENDIKLKVSFLKHFLDEKNLWTDDFELKSC